MSFPYLNTDNPQNSSNEWAFQTYTTLQSTSFLTEKENIEVLHSCLTPPDQRYPVIVREEYKLIWDSAMNLLGKDCRGLVVHGQPGIGKTVFLYYALGRAISEHIPVAWCDRPDFYYHFDIEGVKRLPYGDDPPSSNVLSLFDTTEQMESPKLPFVGRRSQSFVIQATSPKLSRWISWSKQLRASVWVMNVWSAKEIEYLKKLKAPEEGYYDPVQISEYLGPSARQCTGPWPNTGDPAKDFEVDPTDFENTAILLKLLKGEGVEDANQASRFHTFFFTIPHPQSKRPVPPSGKLRLNHLLPTKYLRDLVLETYRKRSREEVERWCSKFRSQPQICGVMYEVFAIQNLWMSQEESTCHFTHNPTVTLPAGLKPYNDVLSTDTPANTIWIAPPGYPAFDAVAVTTGKDGRKCFTFLQITIAQSHKIKNQGITQIWDKMYNTDTVDWRFVFVVPSQEIGERFLREKKISPYYKDKTINEERERVRELGERPTPYSRRDVPVGYMVMKMNEEDRQACVDGFTGEYVVEGGEDDDDDDDDDVMQVEPHVAYVAQA